MTEAVKWLLIEGLVPIESLPGDRYLYHENGRKVIGERSRKSFGIGDKVRVRLDRADSHPGGRRARGGSP